MREIILIATYLLCSFAIKAQINFDPAPDFFRKQRSMPLVSLNTKQDIYVSEHGAIANDGKNDIQGITDAINAAKNLSNSSNPVRVVFDSAGIYDIIPPTGGNHAISFSGANYLLIDGQGAQIMLHNPQVGFMSMLACKSILVQNFFIDYAVLPFTQGKVTAKNASNSTFDLKIDEGFPLLSESFMKDAPEKWGMLRKANGQLKEGTDNLFPYRGWTHISGNTFRVQQPNSSYINQMDVGDYFVQIARNNGKTIFMSNNGENITYLNITSYASPAGTYNVFNHREWNIINCNILVKPGRVHSANADCIHVSGSFLGPWVEGCIFEGQSDDAVNLKFSHRKIISVQSPTQVTVLYDLAVVDTIIFYNPREGLLLGRVRVTETKHVGNNNFQITLSKPVNVTIVGDHQSADQAYVDTRSCESFVFRNNIFRNSRRYGMLLQCSYGVVENCTFENLSNCGIRMENGADWAEGFTANNIEISNNKFINCGFDRTYIKDETAAAISARITKLGTPCNSGVQWCGVETADWQGLKDIRIRNNHYWYNKSALNLQNINRGKLKECELIHNPQDLTIPGKEATAIDIQNCLNLSNECDEINGVAELKQEMNCGFSCDGRILSYNKIDGRDGFINIYDYLGRLAYVEKISDQQNQLSLHFLKQGVYFIVLINGTSVCKQKIFVN